MSKKRPNTEEASLKIPKSYLDRIRENKKKTGVSIVAFVCQAIDEKLNKKHE